MDFATPLPALANSPQLLLAAQVLRALEHRDLPMHARDYRETAAWVKEELEGLGTAALMQLLPRLPASVASVVESLLHEQGHPTWCAGLSAQPNVRTVYGELLARLRQGSR